MKKIKIIALFSLCVHYCHAQQETDGMTKNFERIQWLVGSWNRTNVKAGLTAFEQWTKLSPTQLQGKGVIVKERDTIFVEKFKIVIEGGALYYVADVPENKKPVYFKITKVTANEFVCENPDHDFPKVITYKKEGTKLKATISGNGKSLNYFFEQKL